MSETFTEQYLFETQDGQNLRYVYIACADNTVSGNPFVDLLQRQGFQDTGKTVQFYGETYEQYFSADGKTEALLGVDDDGYWWVIYKPKATEPVAMADVVTLDAAPHSLYKLDTKELLPIYIAVNSAYKDDYGETQFYDLSTITDVQVSADMFDIDTSHLADNGYISLTPTDYFVFVSGPLAVTSTTGISDATRLNNKEEITNNSWFTLDGRKLSGKPTAKGIYIYKGKKQIIK